MRVVERMERIVKWKELGELLGIKIIDAKIESSYFKLTSKTPDGREISTYLRCGDVKGILGINNNVFDYELTPRNDGFKMSYEKEHLRRKFNLKKLKNTLSELMR
jgi:hypothetical protein